MDPNLIHELMSHGGPVLRWRTATELIPEDPDLDRENLQADLLACGEVRRWLDLLGRGPVHHSQDASAENVLAKLCEYGLHTRLHAGLPALDQGTLPYCALREGQHYQAEALILAPFLVRLGYADQPGLASWMEKRLEVLYRLACRGNYDLYMDEDERQRLPPSQQRLGENPKRFYLRRFGSHWSSLGLPTCYDLYALAYLPKEDPAIRRKAEAVVAYLLHPDFQKTPGGYIWDPRLRRPYAAGRVLLACLPGEEEREKLVLFLEMLAQFECGRNSEWFRQGLAHLETYRTERGSYRFPRGYLREESGYYLYAGKHMGLGESPRSARALEMESTFRMGRLKKLDDFR